MALTRRPSGAGLLVTVICLSGLSAFWTAAASPPPPGLGGGATLSRAVAYGGQSPTVELPGVVLLQFSPQAQASARPELGSQGRTGLSALDFRLAGLGAFRIEALFASSADPEAHRAAGLDRWVRVRYDGATPPAEAAIALRGPEVEIAEPDGVCHGLDVIPNDPGFVAQWAHRNTNPAFVPDCDTDDDSAWNYETGSPDLTLAILDTGIDLAHPEFAGRLLPGYDFVNNDADPSDDHGHGTCCAGIAAAGGNNGIGIAGVAWGVRILPVKVLGADVHGSWSALAQGIVFAADNGARIISMSLGGGLPPTTVLNAVNYAYSTKGCLLLAASGNDGVGALEYPAAYVNVVGVGACSPCNQRKSATSCDGEGWWASNYGPDLDFVAPGVLIQTTDIVGGGGYSSDDYYNLFNGTSSATPHAAGVASLVWSYKPELTNAELWGLLEQSAEDIGAYGFDNETGWGRLNAANAIEALIFADATEGPLGDTGHGEGVVFTDMDQDGDPDLFLTRSAGEPDLYLRNDDSTFVDATSGPLADPGEGMGAAAADYDNDGDVDLYIANNGVCRLLRNDGDGFTDVTVPPLDDPYWTSSVSWADFDRDGDLDLLLSSLDDVDRLLRNDGGVFVDLPSPPINNPTPTRSMAWGDYDDDGDLDVYASNEGPNRLLRNYGGGSFGGATPAPLNDAGAGRGCAWADYDNDGDLDLFLANFEGPNRLFRNDGGGSFTDVAPAVMANAGPSNSVAWGDYDNDGDEDLFLTREDLPTLLFRNERGYWSVSQRNGLLAESGAGRGCAWADYDKDGDLDLYKVSPGLGNRLIRNERRQGASWLSLHLVGSRSNRTAVGARVRVKAGGAWLRRDLSAGSTYLSMSSLELHFGLASATSVDSIEIRWPNGALQRLTGIAVGQTLTIEEPELVDVASDARPLAFGIVGVGPNPSSHRTGIRYRLPEAGQATLKIFSADGRLVRTLLDGHADRGSYVTQWDGRDARGHRLPSGVYHARLSQGARNDGWKLLRLE